MTHSIPKGPTLKYITPGIRFQHVKLWAVGENMKILSYGSGLLVSGPLSLGLYLDPKALSLS